MFAFLRKKIGIIGYGNMGSAIAGRIRRKYRVYIFDKDKDKTQALSKAEILDNVKDLVDKSDGVIIAVKPQDFDPVLSEIRECAKDKVFISIAAGITTGYIENILGKAKVIRAMPNIGAIVGESITYICKGKYADNSDLRLSVKLFDCIGHSFILAEDLMKAATAVGGSGPGFWGYLSSKQKIKDFIPELTAAAISVGFDRETAKTTAELVTRASSVTASTLHITPIELTKKVASKGGTTEAGLEVLEKGGTLMDAVKAAARRAEELSKKE